MAFNGKSDRISRRHRNTLSSFLHRHDEAFSTEPIRRNGAVGSGEGGGGDRSRTLRFAHVQELRTVANAAFVYYLRHFPLIFEVFGHLNKQSVAAALSSPFTAAAAAINGGTAAATVDDEAKSASVHTQHSPRCFALENFLTAHLQSDYCCW